MKSIHTRNAPQAIGTYSQAIRHGNTVYISGQIPLVPHTMELCSNDIEEQIEQVMQNLIAVSEAAGGSLRQIVKLTVYLIDMAHFAHVNNAMSRHFSEPFPARAALGVSALPRGALVEMDAIMAISGSKK